MTQRICNYCASIPCVCKRSRQLRQFHLQRKVSHVASLVVVYGAALLTVLGHEAWALVGFQVAAVALLWLLVAQIGYWWCRKQARGTAGAARPARARIIPPAP